MDFMTTLDVLIGLVTVYLVFALTVTALNEALAAALSSRAKWLRRGIASLMSTGANKPANSKAADEAAMSVMQSPYVTYLGAMSGKTTYEPSYVPAWTLMQGILSTVGGVKEDAFAAVTTIRAAADRLPDSPARKVFIDLCARAGNDLALFRTLLDEWFNTFEDQVTAWYKQKTHFVVAALSLALAFAMNVDTMSVVRQLATDNKTRAALVDKGLKAAGSEDLTHLLDTSARDNAKTALSTARTAQTSAEKALANAAAESKEKDVKAKELLEKRIAVVNAETALDQEQTKVVKRTGEMAQGLIDAGLHIGWAPGEVMALFANPKGFFNTAWDVIVKFIGLLISTAAISLGAPFWFNTLKTLASIRSVGPSTDESKAKRAKDKAAP